MYHFPFFLTAGPRVPSRVPPIACLVTTTMTKPPYWNEATAALMRRDPVLRRLIRSYPGIHLKRRNDAFTALARAIVGQQISVKAADAIWGRFVALVSAAPSLSFPRLAPATVATAELVARRSADVGLRQLTGKRAPAGL